MLMVLTLSGSGLPTLNIRTNLTAERSATQARRATATLERAAGSILDKRKAAVRPFSWYCVALANVAAVHPQHLPLSHQSLCVFLVHSLCLDLRPPALMTIKRILLT